MSSSFTKKYRLPAGFDFSTNGHGVLTRTYCNTSRVLKKLKNELNLRKDEISKINERMKGSKKQFCETMDHLHERERELSYQKEYNSVVLNAVKSSGSEKSKSALERLQKLMKENEKKKNKNTNKSVIDENSCGVVRTKKEMQVKFEEFDSNKFLDDDIKHLQLFSELPDSREILMNYLKKGLKTDSGLYVNVFGTQEEFEAFKKDVDKTEHDGKKMLKKFYLDSNEMEYCKLCTKFQSEDTLNSSYGKKMTKKFLIKHEKLLEELVSGSKNRRLSLGKGKKSMTREEIKRKIHQAEFEKQSLARSSHLYIQRWGFTCHMDSIRAFSFAKNDECEVFFTASEDFTMKMWNVNRMKLLRRINPMFTPLKVFRGHVDKVVSLAVSQDYVFSSSMDGTIRQWEIPLDYHDFVEPYLSDDYDYFDKEEVFVGGVAMDAKDIVWSIDYTERKNENLISAVSADSMFWLYNVTDDVFKKKIAKSTEKWGVPTFVKFMEDNKDEVVISFSNGKFCQYNYVKEKEVKVFNIVPPEEVKNNIDHLVYQTVPFATLKNVVAAASEDNCVRLFDTRSGEIVSKMCHEASVTCISENKFSGEFAAGDHDCKVRVWDMKNYKIKQIFQSGRPKGQEGIHSLQYHPHWDYMLGVSSCDGNVKIFNNGEEPPLDEEEKRAKQSFLKEQKRREKKAKRKRSKKKRKKKRKKSTSLKIKVDDDI